MQGGLRVYVCTHSLLKTCLHIRCGAQAWLCNSRAVCVSIERLLVCITWQTVDLFCARAKSTPHRTITLGRRLSMTQR